MPRSEHEVWVPGGTPVVARMLQARIFEGDTEFPVGTTIAYKYNRYSNFRMRVRTEVARFDGKRWDITGETSQFATVELVEKLQSCSLIKVWLLEEGATIHQSEEKENS